MMETTLSTINNTALDISKKAQTNSTINNSAESNMEKNIKSSTADLFPWVCEFQQKFEVIYRDFSIHKLTELMQYYTRNISVSAKECYSKPSWAACLKESISDTLIVFLNIYRMLSENHGRCIYLNYMSDLLAIYIDIELKASKRTKEDQGNICARLISCLYVYLEHSTEHLLDTLIKVQFMYRSYHGILNPVITKIIKNIPLHPESNIMYVRYLLVYRLWRKINSNTPIKNEITSIAVTSLGPPPTFPHLLDGVLPKVPKFQPNPAKLLLHDKFDTRRTCEVFVQFSKESNKNIYKEYSKDVRDTTSSSSICDIEKDVDLTPKNVDNFYNNVNSNLSDNGSCSNIISSHNSCKSVTMADETRLKNLGKISDNISTNRNVPKLFTKIKSFSQRKSKKPQKVILIDLTSDVELEKCLVNKRRSKKPAWLEEAKKQIGLKSMKTSMKMKSRIQKKLDNTTSSKFEAESDYQLQNTSLKTPKITSKNDAVDTFMCDVKISGNTDSENPTLIVSSPPKSLTSEKLSSSMIYTKNINDVNIDTETTKSSSDNNERSLDAPVEIVDAPTTNTRKYYNDNGVLVLKKDNAINDRLKPAVIKRLIEKDISIENEICEKSDGKKKICDLKPQPSIIESITIDSQCNSKDEIDSLNLSKTVEENSTSENVVVYFKNNQDEHGDQNTLVNKNVKSACVKEEQNLSTNSYLEKTGESRNISAIELENSNTNKNIESERCTILKSPIINAYDKKDILINNEILDQQQIFCESQNHSEVSCPGYLNSTISFSVMNGDDSDVQAEVEIDNSIEVDDDMNVVKSIDFENKIYDTEENVINIAKNTAINDNEIKRMCKEDTVNNQYVNQSVEYDKQIYNDNDSAQKDVIENLDKSKSPSYTVSPTIFQKDVQLLKHSHDSNIIKNKNKDTYEIEEINNDSKISDKGYILHCTELNTEENIDGLSLLASVSQHVPHLKAESEKQCDQIKVKDYAVLKNISSNEVIDDETDTNDSSNTISQFCKNPTSELIKRIVGVYPEDGVYPKKVELCVNLISASSENATNAENTSSVNNVPRIFQGSMNYETSDTISNVMVPLENNVQSTKENTNVIHNGETVVLLQKSPNSNLYIINKAVENARNHNDNDTNKITEKSWVSPLSENGSSYEIVNALDHNFIQEKHSIGGKTNIKIEPKEDNAILNLEEKELYTKKISHRTNRLSNLQTTLQDIDAANVTIVNESNDNKHKSSSKSVSACRRNIKQEFTTLPPNRIPTNYTVQGYAGMHSHSHETIESQHPLHIPASHPTALPQSICSNCSAATDLCMPYHKHCKSASCSLQINTTASLHSHVNSNNSCGRSHCSCLNYTYDIVTHCRQCIHPGTDSHVSCIESNSYFLPTHSSVQASTVQEHDRTKNETVIGKLYEDNIVCKVEKDLLQNNTLETIDMKCDTSKLSNTNFNIKLPLKKRIKAHAMMSMHFKEKQIKTEKLDNYPGTPMMSIAALEPLDTIQKHQDQIVKPVFPLSPNRKDDIHGNYHFTANLVRRDYCKDIHDTTTHESNTTACQESYHQRTFKTPAQRKEIAASELTAIKRFTSETMATDVPYKKGKKIQSPTRKTRSSKRNVPKVNYSYTDNDPESDLSGVLKRKRRKNSR
ncbi:PREDICTED: uncharacterized protein LOC106785411 [Polistes canadensis]|uniref:uncharacterized protein LOC106785411 n=1 Tax=Polistes canadensis TaxID=91411 RepID=UPI000718AF69|nr:PREDICTED: uncharacterized protein LOC106785411 [Polistes canadensis]XP_014601335.1 PREDICTED: uncharacterized protein LOC106785411 [Polistes canadensis]XP_014601345.1 PREDICTED: uncharacterized protein LOC106785411 [Polistes canadensis]